MALTYRGQHLEDSPSWLLRKFGAAWAAAFGGSKDVIAGWCREAVKARFPGMSSTRTNLLLRSQEFGNAVWTGYFGKPGVTDGKLAPDGSYTAQEFASADFSGAYSGVIQSLSGPLVGPVTASVWARCVSGTLAVIFGPNQGSSQVFTLTTSWQRLVCTAPGGIGLESGTYRAFVLGEATASNQAWQVWGAQLEYGASATSYIPTVATAVTVDTPGPNSCPSDALPRIAEERGLPRGIVEAESDWRARLVGAWECWAWAGTAYGILRALRLAGFPSVVVQCQSGTQYTLTAGDTGTISDLVISTMPGTVHLGGTPSELWPDLSVLVVEPWPARWAGTAPADGSSDQKTVAARVAQWKGGHNRCVRLQAQKGAIVGTIGLLVGAFTVGAGTTTAWTPPVG